MLQLWTRFGAGIIAPLGAVAGGTAYWMNKILNNKNKKQGR